MKNSPRTDIFIKNLNITIFLDKSIVQKLFNLILSYFPPALFNTEEIQILIFPIFSMLFDLIYLELIIKDY